jgi:hypothetical protein
VASVDEAPSAEAASEPTIDEIPVDEPSIEAAADEAPAEVEEVPALEAFEVEADLVPALVDEPAAAEPVADIVLDEPATVAAEAVLVGSYDPPVVPLDEGSITTAEPLEPIALSAPGPGPESGSIAPVDEDAGELSSSGD